MEQIGIMKARAVLKGTTENRLRACQICKLKYKTQAHAKINTRK